MSFTLYNGVWTNPAIGQELKKFGLYALRSYGHFDTCLSVADGQGRILNLVKPSKLAPPYAVCGKVVSGLKWSPWVTFPDSKEDFCLEAFCEEGELEACWLNDSLFVSFADGNKNGMWLDISVDGVKIGEPAA